MDVVYGGGFNKSGRLSTGNFMLILTEILRFCHLILTNDSTLFQFITHNTVNIKCIALYCILKFKIYFKTTSKQ